MKCRECEEQLQACLDDGRLMLSSEMHDHVRECEACRRDVGAARVLLGGLSSLPKPETSQLMTASITAAVRADYVARRRRSTYRWYATAGLAACLLVLFGMGWLAPLWKATLPPVAVNADRKRPELEKPASELALRAEDAKKAVASLTRSVAETTKSRVNSFLPQPGSLDVGLPSLPEFDEPLDPAAKSLKQAGISVAHSLDPVAQTTARAFGFFAREMPVLDFNKD